MFLDEKVFLGIGQMSSMSKRDEHCFIFHRGYLGCFDVYDTTMAQPSDKECTQVVRMNMHKEVSVQSYARNERLVE